MQAKDEYNASVEDNFTVTLIDIFEDLDSDGIEDHLDDDMDGDGYTNQRRLAYPSDPRDPNSKPNEPPFDLNTTALLTISENQPVGTVVGQFNATDPDGDPITYHLVSGEGDADNSLFTLDQNGTLKTAVVLGYEAGSSVTIRVQARDEYNASVEDNFIVSVLPRNNWFHSISGFSGMHRMNLAVSDHKSFGVVGGKKSRRFCQSGKLS